jgi:phosphoribosylformylglycinamidine synthase
VLLGRTVPEFGGSHAAMVLGDDELRAVPSPDPGAAWRYRLLHEALQHGLGVSAHDCSEGGLAVALAEMAIAGRLGCEVDVSVVADDAITALFSESVGRIVCEVAPDHLTELKEHLGDDVVIIGHVTAGPAMIVNGQFEISLDALVAAFTGATR